MTYFTQKNRQNQVAGGIKHDYDLAQSISLNDLVQEIDLQEDRLKKLKDELQNSPKCQRIAISRSSLQGGGIEEVPISPVLEKRLNKALRHIERLTCSDENVIRGKIVGLLGSSFLVTTIISGGMTWFAATNPETVNGQLIKDWTNTMITAEVGFISAVLGYYFGVVDRNKSHINDPDSDQSQDR